MEIPKRATVMFLPPKRAKSAYLFYVLRNKSQLVEKYPHLNGRAVHEKLASEWKKISDEERLKYITMSDADRSRYLRQKFEFEQEGRYYDNAGFVVKSFKILKEHRSTKRKVLTII